MISKLTKLSFILICFCALFFASCGDNNANQGTLEGAEYTSAYICPMHCEGSGSTEMGTCPVCKMDYVVNEDKTAPVTDPHEGHSHDTHEGHNH